MAATKKSTKKTPVKKTPTRKDGRIPIMSPEFKERVLKNLEKNRTYGGLGSTEEEAEEIAAKLKKEGYQTLISKAGEHAWLVEKSKVSFKDL